MTVPENCLGGHAAVISGDGEDSDLAANLRVLVEQLAHRRARAGCRRWIYREFASRPRAQTNSPPRSPCRVVSTWPSST
jgi:hypothetical protein